MPANDDPPRLRPRTPRRLPRRTARRGAGEPGRRPPAVAAAPRERAADALAPSVLGFVRGGHRPRAMVWNHVVTRRFGILSVTPAALSQRRAALVRFRPFDGGKPPPIRQLDHRSKGGFGIMADNLAAAFLTPRVIATWRFLFSTLR